MYQILMPELFFVYVHGNIMIVKKKKKIDIIFAKIQILIYSQVVISRIYQIIFCIILTKELNEVDFIFVSVNWTHEVLAIKRGFNVFV